MKRIIAIFFLLAMTERQGLSRTMEVNELRQAPDSAQYDTTHINGLNQLGQSYMFIRPDSGIFYGNKALHLSRKINFISGEIMALRTLAFSLRELGNYPTALQVNLKNLKLSEKHNLLHDKALILGQIGLIYNSVGDFQGALKILNESKEIFDSIPEPDFSLMTQSRLINTYQLMGQYDLALYYSKLAIDELEELQNDWPKIGVYVSVGEVYKEMSNYPMATKYFIEIEKPGIRGNTSFAPVAYFNLAQIKKNLNDVDSSIYYIEKSLASAQLRGSYPQIIDAYRMMADIYEVKDPVRANEYNRLALAYKDSLELIGKTVALETFIEFDEQERQQELATAEAEFQSRLRTNAFLGGSFTLIIIVLLLYRSNRAKHKSARRMEKAYNQLQSAQNQLIQSEKMASLGELTAGIAHEIQNPLNFVNNFSEVNSELIEDLKIEFEKGNYADATNILNDLKKNEGKIRHHGQRADAIVKSMLQHTRTSSGEKELTDINALCDEYLRLAYHGFRAKDKNFNAQIKLDLDPTLSKIKVVPQDIGRVLLNLINNAFQATSAKAFQGTAGSSYEPQVTVSTKAIPFPGGAAGNAGALKITVTDNGPGIPDEIKDKIFQPFFTTKPTGQGTGLGLSLSYDIVKALGGTLTVDSKVGEGTVFKIHLDT